MGFVFVITCNFVQRSINNNVSPVDGTGYAIGLAPPITSILICDRFCIISFQIIPTQAQTFAH